ncbi:hypothetical protein Plav_2047 [Parvibaculum lavamentivorans DS-1]|uniref:AB hydrolase-1 domain-containing protein n=1 Tax=Parvibaculum lavamentivorans (strain DS-1 / DSM 13023 / NCIMB 13966) TaxID=402881 RepID=A7HUS8_PARL1|nr:ABC-three component system protein [Parvibaculum lavamentivorans]ABS63661.1 hypothetical protein Plav_2047 [Parvibaculum lavamentivorans DS-1]
MSDGPHFSKVCAGGEPRLDVLFVHGLTGDPRETWTSGGPEQEYWPKWLCEELEGVSVYALGYPSSIFGKWAKKEMNLHERAGNMLEHLAANGIGARPIALVGHSLGGILVKEMLRASNECADRDWQAIAAQTRLAVFMATPHKGASLASAVKLIVPRLSSTHVDLLSNDSGYLTSLNQAYRDFANGAGIATVAYYEKYKTKGSSVIVPEDSADPGVGATRPVAVDADHISICKPAKRTDLIYVSLCRHLKAVLQQCSMSAGEDGALDSFASDDYGTSSESDRRDLLQKLIDAGREHEYQKANSLQNKFAQRYYKLGLHTDAKTKSDAVLAAVEQRFFTHVYGGKICKGATDEEIAAALQVHVIDPLCSGTGKDHLSPTAILQALYFLTEQCYIQWDAA